MGERIAVVRHGLPNNKFPGVGELTLDLDSQSAAIIKGGELQESGFDVSRIAISEGHVRTWQTASSMQVVSEREDTLIKYCAKLNEVNTRPRSEVVELFGHGILPEEFLPAGRRLLENMPQEDVWVTHNSKMGALLGAVKAIMPQKFELPSSLIIPFLGHFVLDRSMVEPPILCYEPVPLAEYREYEDLAS